MQCIGQGNGYSRGVLKQKEKKLYLLHGAQKPTEFSFLGTIHVLLTRNQPILLWSPEFLGTIDASCSEIHASWSEIHASWSEIHASWSEIHQFWSIRFLNSVLVILRHSGVYLMTSLHVSFWEQSTHRGQKYTNFGLVILRHRGVLLAFKSKSFYPIPQND